MKEIFYPIKKKDTLDLSINEIKKQATEIYMKKDTLNIVTESEEGRTLIQIKNYPNGQTKTIGNFEKLQNKKDYKETIKKMKENGLTQQEISMNLGISQGYISKLLKNKN